MLKMMLSVAAVGMVLPLPAFAQNIAGGSRGGRGEKRNLEAHSEWQSTVGVLEPPPAGPSQGTESVPARGWRLPGRA